MPTYFEEIDNLKKELLKFWVSTKQLQEEIEDIDEFGYFSLNYNCRAVTNGISDFLNLLYNLEHSYTVVLKDQ